MKQWLHDMLKLLNQKSDQNLESEKKRLDALHQRHVEMLPGIEENMRKVRGEGKAGDGGTGIHSRDGDSAYTESGRGWRTSAMNVEE